MENVIISWQNYDKMGELKKEELKKKEAAQAEHAGENVTE